MFAVGGLMTSSWTALAILLSLGAAGERDASSASPPEPAASAPAATTAPVPPAPGASAPAPATPSSSTEARRFLRVAVYDFSTDGIEPRVGRFVTDAMVDELRKLDGVTVVAMDEVRALLAHEAMREMTGCTDGDSCLSELGDALGVDEIVVGTLAVVGGASVVTIRRIDQGQARAIGSMTRRLVPNGGEEFLAEIGPAVTTLYKDKALREGQSRGVPRELARRLNPPPLKPWLPLATATGAVVVTVAAAGAGVAALNEEAVHAALVDEARRTPVSGTLVVGAAERARGFALAANVLYGSAAVIGLAALAMLPFTDFEGAPAE